MKKLLIGLLALSAFSVFADKCVIHIENEQRPQVASRNFYGSAEDNALLCLNLASNMVVTEPGSIKLHAEIIRGNSSQVFYLSKL